MKSYFAKLADRATFANVPASSAVYTAKVSDPFADTSPPQTPLPPLEFDGASRSLNETSGFALGPPPQGTPSDKIRPLVETHEPVLVKPSTPSTTLLPKSPASVPSLERVADGRAELESEKEPQTVPTEQSILEANPSRMGALTPLQVPASPPQSKTTSEDKTTKRSATETAPTEERLADLEREQSILLRKADVFMDQLLERPRQPAITPEVKADRKSQNILRPDVQRDQITQPPPIHSVPRTSGPNSDRPSLVIGKLTVEVMPATPAPVAPPQQVVVVRGTRSRGNGLLSGRRFGLGQF